MRDFDESDVKIRPNRRGSRPRTKRRPEHADAVIGMVIGVDRGRFAVRIDSRDVKAIKARELGRRGIVVGDKVRVVGDASGKDGSLARIVGREKRSTALRRTADDADTTERVVVANADQLAIVTALADPEPNSRMIDRCVIAAYDAGLEALLVLTKNDLGSPAELERHYQPLGVHIMTTSVSGDDHDGLEALGEALTGHTTVLVGYSGVGKSTLVNALLPDADRAIGHVNEVTGRGRHTSTSAVALELPGGGWIVDTPGVRTFGLAHVDDEHLLAAFPDVAEAATNCLRGCTHRESESGCALDDWAQSVEQATRLESIRRLIDSRLDDERR